MENNKTKWSGRFNDPPQSYWIASTPETNYPKLDSDVKVDVAIVGGGITGITAAWLLKKEGLKVAIIEADRIIQGTTGHTTAKLTSQHDLIYYDIKKNMGVEKAHQYAEANESAIKLVENIIKEKNIDCDFHKCPAYIYTQQDKYLKQLQDEAETAASLGIKADLIDEVPLPFNIKAALRYENQARFHPRKYLLSLAQDIPGEGSYIFEQTRAIDIHEGNTCAVSTLTGRKVSAENVIIASHYPFYDGYGMYFSRIYPDRSYAIGVLVKGNFPDGMYINAEEPARSIRWQEYKDGKIMITGGEHHKTGQSADTNTHYDNIIKFTEETFDMQDVLYRWSTQDYTPADKVPYVGRLTSKSPNIYVATGFRKWGMTNGNVSAMIIKDMIVKGGNPWEPVYNPSRFTPAASAKKFVSENANVVKELVKGKLTAIPDDVEIKNGEAKVFEKDGDRVGAYRDNNGKLHVVNTTCTHLGCEIMWNTAEKSWDCPCHGSRFTYEGEIIDGPALKSIKREM